MFISLLDFIYSILHRERGKDTTFRMKNNLFLMFLFYYFPEVVKLFDDKTHPSRNNSLSHDGNIVSKKAGNLLWVARIPAYFPTGRLLVIRILYILIRLILGQNIDIINQRSIGQNLGRNICIFRICTGIAIAAIIQIEVVAIQEVVVA